MENWITKIGYPVLTVTENANGITVRQDRFLETGAAEPKDNETIWCVLIRTVVTGMLIFFLNGRNIPLSILSVKDGQAVVDKSAILQEREKNFPLDTSKPFKLNAGTAGVCKFINTFGS